MFVNHWQKKHEQTTDKMEEIFIEMGNGTDFSYKVSGIICRMYFWSREEKASNGLDKVTSREKSDRDGYNGDDVHVTDEE